MYATEEYLVNDFVSSISNSPFTEGGPLKIAKEFDYRNGRTDIVVLNGDGQIIAFEAKLSRWRDALHQAYKNTCFANYSYIVVPEEIAKKASKFAAEFSRRSVGICYITNNRIVIEQSAEENIPIQKHITEKAKTFAVRESTNGRTY
jgi:hypothetical protein